MSNKNLPLANQAVTANQFDLLPAALSAPPAVAEAAARGASSTALTGGSEAARASEPVIHALDLSEAARDDLVKIARGALSQAATYKERAQIVKKALDKSHGPGKWHVVVGASFGSYVTHQTGAFCFFTLDGVSFLAFKG
jgi:dynein light chain LC8-type